MRGWRPSQAQAYIDTLLHETGWRPTVTQSFTGAVAYTRYGWWYRWYLKRISRRKGLPTDTSRDWDFTEWSEVERFAEKLAVTFALASGEAPGPRLLSVRYPPVVRGSTAAVRSWAQLRS